MIIVSQDRKFMINFYNVHSIVVDNDRNYENYFINFVVSSGDGTLGTYKTEERADEILQEIIERYRVINTNSVYEMPEE